MDTSTQANVSQTVERLTPKLQAIAWRVADTGSRYEPEDVYQDMTLALVEQSDQEPAFLEQKDNYILSLCSWRGRNKAQSKRTYDKYNQPENFGFELISDRTAGPEEAIEMGEMFATLKNAIERLSVKDREILSLLVIDCTPAEISRKLGVTRSAISQRLSRIRRTLTATFDT